MKIKKSFLPKITSLIGLGFIALLEPATAATIDDGRMNFVWEQEFEFVNNAVDFDPDNTDFDPTNPLDGGIFNITRAVGGFANYDGLGSTFEDKQGLSVDFYIPSSAIPGGTFLNGVTYDIVEIFQDNNLPGLQTVSDPGGEPMTGIPTFFYDLNDNGNFFDDEDAIFYSTTVNRTANEEPLGGFDVDLSFNGFIYTPSTDFNKTTVEFTLLNGATAVDPDSLPAVDFPIENTPSELPAPKDFSNLDGVQVTMGVNPRPVPEPGMVMGLLVASGIAGLVNKSKKKQQS